MHVMSKSQLAVTVCISLMPNGCCLQLVDQEVCQCSCVCARVCVCVVAYDSLLVEELHNSCTFTAGLVKGTMDLTLPRRLFAC